MKTNIDNVLKNISMYLTVKYNMSTIDCEYTLIMVVEKKPF